MFCQSAGANHEPTFSAHSPIRLESFGRDGTAPLARRRARDARSAQPASIRHAPFSDVSVWYVWHTAQSQLDAFHHALTDADYAEFADIRHGTTRDRSLRTRALLRASLSEAVQGQLRPADWAFERNAHGKPCLRPYLPNLHFSCSHAHSASVIAVSRQHPVGIDIESSFLTFEDPSLLEEYFSEGERQAIERLPEHRRAKARVRLWTLKEAVVKMLGTGLALDISQLEFDAEDDRLKSNREPEIDISGMRLATWSVTTQLQPLSVALAVNH